MRKLKYRKIDYLQMYNYMFMCFLLINIFLCGINICKNSPVLSAITWTINIIAITHFTLECWAIKHNGEYLKELAKLYKENVDIKEVQE